MHSLESIFAIFRRDLKPMSETEEMILLGAAQAQYRAERAAAALLAELDRGGYTDLYFKLQRSEAKDRAALNAYLNQYRQLESRRIRMVERLKKKLDAALDRAVTPRTDQSTASSPMAAASPRRTLSATADSLDPT